MDTIKISLEEKTKISLAEVYWFLSDIGTATAQEVSKELGISEQVVQNQLNTLEGLGIIRRCGSPKCYTPERQIPEPHLKWLGRYESLALRTTKQLKDAVAQVSPIKGVEYHRGLQELELNIRTLHVGSSQGYYAYLFDWWIALQREPSSILFDSREAVIVCGIDFPRDQPSADEWLEWLAKLHGRGTILFDSKEAAEQVAWATQAEWDGLNGVTIERFDRAALETATGLAGAKYCWEGQQCQL